MQRCMGQLLALLMVVGLAAPVRAHDRQHHSGQHRDRNGSFWTGLAVGAGVGVLGTRAYYHGRNREERYYTRDRYNRYDDYQDGYYDRYREPRYGRQYGSYYRPVEEGCPDRYRQPYRPLIRERVYYTETITVTESPRWCPRHRCRDRCDCDD